jgi:glycosyltransferase involved in cell wall biosynthesis
MNKREDALRVAISAELLLSGESGGIESVLVGLISALGKLDDGDEEYVVIAHWQQPEILKRFIGPNQRIVVGRDPSRVASSQNKSSLEKLKIRGKLFAGKLLHKMYQISGQNLRWPQIPISDGFYESLQCNALHFPFQRFVLCSIPTIYNPHDLQHRHYPEFFSPAENARRELLHRSACNFTHAVAVASQWVKNDIISQFTISPEKIQVIPWAAPTQPYSVPSADELSDIKNKYKLEPPFCLYPAVTWPHKNHLRLLEALALARDRDQLSIRLVCTGNLREPHSSTIRDKIQALKLNRQVQFLGSIPANELRAVYRLSQFVVIPTLFEASSMPLFEAWQEGLPVACSTVTSLPQQARDAAILFDPMSVHSIAGALVTLSADSNLREELSRKGVCRLKDFSWERTARAYRALYRKLAKRPLTEEDQLLLKWDWMKDREIHSEKDC